MSISEKEINERAKRFVDAIEKGELKKQILPNMADEFDIKAASDSFDAFISSEEFNDILKKAYK